MKQGSCSRSMCRGLFGLIVFCRDAVSFARHRLFSREKRSWASLAVDAKLIGDGKAQLEFSQERAVLFHLKLKRLKLRFEIKLLKLKFRKRGFDLGLLKLRVKLLPVRVRIKHDLFWFMVWLGWIDPVKYRNKRWPRRSSFRPNVKEHAPPLAGAHAETGVEVHITGGYADRAASGGCCVSSCSALPFFPLMRIKTK